MADLNIRPYEDTDEAAVLALLSASLGWVPDGHHAAFFRWKHLDNAFGRSAMWVATDAAGAILGFRSMMRWAFTIDGELHQAVRAVDTATHPDAQGKGIFRTLTMHAVDQLTDEGVSFVFNTPNDQSRPGYLKMGWQEVGRLPAAVRPRSPLALLKMVRSRVPASLWSTSTDAGVPAAEALRDADDFSSLLAHPGAGLRTAWTPERLRWRYAGFPALDYRALRYGGDLAVFRLRKRREATEAVLCAAFTDHGEGGTDHLARSVSRSSAADYVLRLGKPTLHSREWPLPGGGPILTWRALAQPVMTPASRWNLEMGDVELF